MWRHWSIYSYRYVHKLFYFEPNFHQMQQVWLSLTTQKMIAASRAATLLQKQIRVRSNVIEGFGTGARLLGWPTANVRVDADFIDKLQELELKNGVYSGFATVALPDNSNESLIHKALINIGTRPDQIGPGSSQSRHSCCLESWVHRT